MFETDAEITALLARANARITVPRIPQARIRTARQTLARVNDDVQKAGAAMKAGDYAAAEPALKGVKERIEKVIADLNVPVPTQSSRRRR